MCVPENPELGVGVTGQLGEASSDASQSVRSIRRWSANGANMLVMSKSCIQHKGGGGGVEANCLSLAGFTFHDPRDAPPHSIRESGSYLPPFHLHPIIAAARLWIVKEERRGANYPSGRTPPPSPLLPPDPSFERFQNVTHNRRVIAVIRVMWCSWSLLSWVRGQRSMSREESAV